MRSMFRGCLVWCSVALLAVACGGGADRTKAHVRLVNATGGYSTLNLKIGDTTVSSSVAYGATADYDDVDPSQTEADISRPGSATVLSTKTVALAKNQYYTMLAYGDSGALASVLLDDNTGTPASGKSLVRVLNAAPDAGALDVYLTGSSDSLTDASALQSSAAYGTVGSFTLITSGSWRLRVTAAGSKTDVRLDVSALNFGSESVKTLVLTPGRGGVLVNALLLAQQGGIDAGTNNQARVRVVAGVDGGAAVSASVGGTTLMSAAGAPALTGYSTLASGTVAVAASASGTAASLSSATLEGGGDYTLLVYGTPSAPVATLIEDDNSLPSDSSSAKVRLVHGLADVGDTLTLLVDLQIEADGVGQGAASSPALVPASSTSRIRVTSSGGATLFNDDSTSTDRNFVANGVYTFFILGDSTTPVGVLKKDR